MDQRDIICIEELRLSAHVGVTEEERANGQPIVISLKLEPLAPLKNLSDDIANTINYADVARLVREIVAKRSDKLIETLAEQVAAGILRAFAVERVCVELRKFVFEDAAHVAVVLERSRAD